MKHPKYPCTIGGIAAITGHVSALGRGLVLGAMAGAIASCGAPHGASPGTDAAACADPGGCEGAPTGDAPAGDAPACTPVSADGRRLLSQVGLYADISSLALAAGVTEYQPAYGLWSDGADKRRFIALPDGAKIDTSDMDHWQFPVGTKLFKEFALAGQRLETRMIERTAATGADADYTMSTFVWLAGGCDAVETPMGASNVLGTTHDVPDSGQCRACHGGEPGRVLGFSAIQLAKPGPAPTLASLAASGRLTVVPPATGSQVPGPPATAAALGYLHANCGHCHNPNGVVAPANTLSMNLRLNFADRTPEATTIWRTTVDVATEAFHTPGIVKRVARHDAAGSALLYRMTKRRTVAQMPSLATKTVDSDGVAAVRAWISSLPTP